MEISLIGAILIPVGFTLFLFAPKALFYCAIFFVPFTGTAVVKFNVGAINAEGVRASMFLLTLCLAREVVSVVRRASIPFPASQRAPLGYLIALSLVVISSLAMPILIDGRYMVIDAYTTTLMYANEIPLVFRAQWLTQAAYFVFGCLVSYLVAIRCKSVDELNATMRIYIYASLFAAAWGLFELCAYYSGISYPSFLFNQNSANAHGTMVLNGVPRITSVALEPSILAQQLLTVIPLLYFLSKRKVSILGAHLDRVTILILVVTLLLSASATAYLGLAFAYILSRTVLFRTSVTNRTVFVLEVLAVLAAMLALFPLLAGYVTAKAETFSGVERLSSIAYALKYFWNYPVLGIGWGVMPSWDLVACLLAGSGVVGFSLFLALIGTVLRRLRGPYDDSGFANKSNVRIGIFISLLVLLFVSEISGFVYHAQYFWVVLGLAISALPTRNHSVTPTLAD